MKPDSRLASMVAKVRAIGDKAESEVSVLFDTGATESFVLHSVAEKLSTIVKLPRPFKITVADGRSLTISETVVLVIEAAGQMIMDTFLLLENGIEDVILGESTMRKFGLKIDLEHGAIFSELKAQQIKESSMKEFIAKLFAKLGISESGDVSEEKAVELVAARLEQIKTEKPKITPPAAPKNASAGAVSASLLAALELPEGATEEEARGKILALKHPGNVVPAEQFASLQEKFLMNEIHDLVTSALRPGEGEMEGKLYVHERQWAIDQAKKDLEGMRHFIRNRPKVLAFMNKLPDQKRQAVVIDSVQADMNKQLKVDKETFAKYNAPE